MSTWKAIREILPSNNGSVREDYRGPCILQRCLIGEVERTYVAGISWTLCDIFFSVLSCPFSFSG